MNLKVEVLGEPRVQIDGEVVSFPYQKVEALFYYLVVKEKVSRVKAASLLWGGMREKKAKKNLRNALYQLKKTVGENLVKTPDRSTILFAPSEGKVECDLNTFLTDKDKKAIKAYKKEFLAGFLINKAGEFTNWLMEKRNYYEQLYIEKLKRYINSLQQEERNKEAIECLEDLIRVDEFDEASYRNLMNLYAKEGKTAKAIDTYKKLEFSLDEKLGINPDSQTVDLLQSIKTQIPDQKEEQEEKNKFIERNSELDLLIDNLYRFSEGEEAKSYLISGEAGIGKTALVNKVLSSVSLNNCLVLQVDCFQAEERYTLNLWRDILKKLEKEEMLTEIDSSFPWRKRISALFPSVLEGAQLKKELDFESLQIQSIVEALLFLLAQVANRQKIVLVIDDLHWCDDKSLLFLKRLLRENKDNILVLATIRQEKKRKVKELFADFKRQKNIEDISLARFNFTQVDEFVRQALPSHDLSEEFMERIYCETEGNPFFVAEIVKLLSESRGGAALSQLHTTDKSQNILRSRIRSVSEEAQKILRLAAVCFRAVSYELLANVSDKTDFELIKLLEELEEKHLLEEINKSGKPVYTFTHSLLRKFVYEQQSSSRRTLLHRRIAQFKEQKSNQLNESRVRFPDLIYHYSKAGDKLKHLEYLIKEANIYFHQTRELFPVLSDKKLKRNRIISYNGEEANSYLSKIESLIQEAVQLEGETDKLEVMEVKFLTMKGRYLISEGEYRDAIDNIAKMISKAKQINDKASMLEGYQELAGLGIQQERLEFIRVNAQKMYSLAEELNKEGKKGIALRFLGVVQLYSRNYMEAEKIFNQALETFWSAESVGQRYTLSVAAIYNYLGEVKRYQEKFKKAVEFYNKGINLCEEKGIRRGVGIFYTNAGRAFFRLKEHSQAEDSFKKALGAFSGLDIIWGYDTLANGFMALLEFKKGNYKQAYEYLRTAEELLDQHYKRYWAGILYQIKAEIAWKMKQNKEIKDQFGDYLLSNSKQYAQKAQKIFQEVGASYEAELVKGS